MGESLQHNHMVTLVPILGGLASGFVGGILTVETRARRERRIAEKEWYERIIRLAERVKRAHVSDYGKEDARYARDAGVGVLGSLTELIMNSPLRISDDLLESAEELSMKLQILKQRDFSEASRNPKRIADDMEPAVKAAEDVIEKARAEKETVGYL